MRVCGSKYVKIYTSAGIAKWSNASDCKSAGFGLRRFDSYSQHHFDLHPATVAGFYLSSIFQ